MSVSVRAAHLHVPAGALLRAGHWQLLSLGECGGWVSTVFVYAVLAAVSGDGDGARGEWEWEWECKCKCDGHVDLI